MVNKETGFILSDKSPAAGDSSTARRHLTKPEFAYRVYELMQKKGWSQSDLSRAAGVSRNNISSYINGKSFPSRLNLGKLAKALGQEPEELLPNVTAAALGAEKMPELSLTTSGADPEISWLIINTRVSTHVGIEILTRLKADRLNTNPETITIRREETPHRGRRK